jgi:hypothetical protein
VEVAAGKVGKSEDGDKERLTRAGSVGGACEDSNSLGSSLEEALRGLFAMARGVDLPWTSDRAALAAALQAAAQRLERGLQLRLLLLREASPSHRGYASTHAGTQGAAEDRKSFTATAVLPSVTPTSSPPPVSSRLLAMVNRQVLWSQAPVGFGGSTSKGGGGHGVGGGGSDRTHGGCRTGGGKSPCGNSSGAEAAATAALATHVSEAVRVLRAAAVDVLTLGTTTMAYY